MTPGPVSLINKLFSPIILKTFFFLDRGTYLRLVLITLAFLISYIFFFIKPVFLNADGIFYSKAIIPAMTFNGSDLEVILRCLASWWGNGVSPYNVNTAYWYPPFGTLIFAPLLYVSFPNAYSILTILTVIAYTLSTVFIPLLLNKDNHNDVLPYIVLFAVSGAFSYGFQFELERGQFNMIVFFLCILAIYLYHKSTRYRYVSCLLLVVATQLKLYPAIFVLMLVKDWRDWGPNLGFFVTFVTANVLCLFVMGTSVLLDFLNNLWSGSSDPDFFVWIGSHSIKSFSGLIPIYGQRVLAISAAWLTGLKRFFSTFLLLLFVVSFVAIWWNSRRHDNHEVNASLLLGCTIGACLISPVSCDYKLPILITPVLMYLLSKQLNCSKAPNWFKSITIFIVALAYFSTLYSYWYKPFFLANNAPMLMVILITVAVNSFFEAVNRPQETSNCPDFVNLSGHTKVC